MTDDQALESRRRRILIIGNTAKDLRLLCKTLGGQGHQVHCVMTGAAALRFLEATLPDLILLDVAMPNKTGADVCKQLKANSRTRDIPTIFISAYEDSSAKVKAFSAGAWITSSNPSGRTRSSHASTRNYCSAISKKICGLMQLGYSARDVGGQRVF